MSKMINLGSETRRGRRRASPESVVANDGHPVTLDVLVRLEAIALPEADGGFTVVILPFWPGDLTVFVLQRGFLSSRDWILAKRRANSTGLVS